ncbi:hypothetical protein BDV38DRAFT_278065 [Aspergillus pseudotamarii]|uniref:Uncharacterized protein n=1 Tax=Aspergillus pseudotamarii TaxID=132259 RepID=A0A5N6T886_ASPPS|nr:uncharacterized protein BDV38DRAFT_278065 [Aspergillus pseudotamarii]KAE8142543.1 hypothetical protein BDV38DRAFT_278065 [Aspergillus pseudotamarii]
MRSLLGGTFFKADIECNLVSAWLSPAFAVINPILEEGSFVQLATALERRQPKLTPLWLGALMTGLARSGLRDIRNGLTAIDLTQLRGRGTTNCFITPKPGVA